MKKEISVVPCPFHEGKLCSSDCPCYARISKSFLDQPSSLRVNLQAVIQRWLRHASFDREEMLSAEIHRKFMPEISAMCKHEDKM